MKSIIIREANESDTGELEKLFQTTRKKTFKATPAQKFIIGDYAKSVEGEEVWVAEIDGNLAGFISFWHPNNFIHNLFIHPDWQNRGIGQQLLKKGEERLSRPMELKVTIDNLNAFRFYEKHGWEKISTHKGAPEDYILYRKS